MNKTLMVSIALAVVLGIGGFFAGMKYQQSKLTAARFGNVQGARTGANRNGNGFRPVDGDIISTGDNSITVKLSDGSTKIVILSGSTQINKAETASKNDLTVGQKVAVFGTQNSDGSVTAQNIQLNPIIRNEASPTPTATP